ncbi:hypothetical protein [Streptomyces inhibens]|uniref:hypothetical protein n=1 Tax=Streptomyces inhibens TaxID=2293571 RepID=UPI001EE7496B|nr:hypothetical protein [Streptomyces inhibens]UKY47649.1 hypothetical protein KI385_01555 [Streptomyces inhibens]
MSTSTTLPRRPRRREEPLQRLLFGGVYGSVLASVLAAALGHDTGTSDPGYDAVWVLLAGAASAAAHGYAHSIAHRTGDKAPVTTTAVRSMLTEWPLVAAMLPTVAALFGAYAGWWGEEAAVDVALTLNTVTLFGWGVWAARVAGRGWAAACRVGAVDMLLGLCIVAANVLSK